MKNYNLSFPLQLIQKTIEQGAVYLTSEHSLSLAQITPNLHLSASQQVALNLCLANTPLMVIQGVPGSGKTRLAQVLARGLIEQQKRILILTHYPETKSVYQNLSVVPFSLSCSQDYDTWLTEKLQQQYLGKLPMDFLPVHLLPDSLLEQLRLPQKLEKWLFILQDNDRKNEIKSLLQTEFPQASEARLNLLAYRLQKLVPLLQQQLWLHQQSAQLSQEAAIAITEQIKQQASIPILGTVSEFLQAQHQELRQIFDCVIVEEAEYLSWEQLKSIAKVAQKLILLGNLPLNLSLPNRTNYSQSFPLAWLGEFLLPTYCYRLTEQFRLHSAIAKPVFETLYNQRIRTQPQSNVLTLPQLTARLQWQDVRGKAVERENLWEGKRLLKFMSDLGATRSMQIGILAFTEAQRNWLRNHCPPEFSNVAIGSFADWVGKEIKILLVSCVGDLENLTIKNLAIALTRASDYLILFGDYQLWSDRVSPMQDLLSQPELQREREVSLL
jgi:energy-coupling factor transporter ATP-binding protein EcfA2